VVPARFSRAGTAVKFLKAPAGGHSDGVSLHLPATLSVARVPERRSLLLTFFSLAATSLVSCSQPHHLSFDPPLVCRIPGPVSESVFLIGDAGAAATAGDPVLTALSRDVAESVGRVGAERTAVVVLGDNVYPAGMAPPGDPDHERAARVLDAQVAAIGSARGLFALGNHDWDQGEERGFARARAQSRYLASRASNISVHPPDACPGPDSLPFGDHLFFVFIDVWAGIYQIDHPGGPLDACATDVRERQLGGAVDEALRERGKRRAILVSHPPLLTSGPHGGYFRWLEHLFPLRVFHPDLWIPLPVLGSAFPIARQLGVTDTDQMSARYQRYVDGAKKIFAPEHPTLVVSGHEHSLQVHVDPTGVFHAVSGAGSVKKVDYVRDMKSDLMAMAAPGYMRLDVYADSTLRLGVYAVESEGTSQLVFSTCIP
jgi:hypothetical protein